MYWMTTGGGVCVSQHFRLTQKFSCIFQCIKVLHNLYHQLWVILIAISILTEAAWPAWLKVLWSLLMLWNCVNTILLLLDTAEVYRFRECQFIDWCEMVHLLFIYKLFYLIVFSFYIVTWEASAGALDHWTHNCIPVAVIINCIRPFLGLPCSSDIKQAQAGERSAAMCFYRRPQL